VTEPSSPDCAAFDPSAVPLPLAPVDPAQVVSGEPQAAAVALAESGGLEVGVWEHTTGVSTDVEVDEVFVVLAGRASVDVEGGPTLELAPGSVGVLRAGARTTWRVHEPLRKVYVVRTQA
jgi:uncharacterized cupin superfamily protein